MKQLPNVEETVAIIQHQSAYIRQLESEIKLSQVSETMIHIMSIRIHSMWLLCITYRQGLLLDGYYELQGL